MGAKTSAQQQGTIFWDLRDGDEKRVQLEGDTMVITAPGWSVRAPYAANVGCAQVDFRVQGKPDPPPVELEATSWSLMGSQIWEFTDATGTLATANYPLNHWVSVDATTEANGSIEAITGTRLFADICDGDQKRVICEDGALCITPAGPPLWTVFTHFDAHQCAMVDFKVPGKDNYPPVPLRMALCFATNMRGQRKAVLEFSDPSGELSAPGVPLNHWVELPAAI